MAHGQGPNQIPAARGIRAATSLCSMARQLLGHANFHGRHPVSTFTEDGRYLKRCPPRRPTRTKSSSYIETNRGDGKPFFAYVSHQAPHDPYHLPGTGATGMSANTTKGWDRAA